MTPQKRLFGKECKSFWDCTQHPLRWPTKKAYFPFLPSDCWLKPGSNRCILKMPWVSKQYIFLLAFMRQTSHWNRILPSWCYCCCCCCCFCYCYRLLQDCKVDSLKSWYTLPWNPGGFLPPGNPGGKRKRFVANNIWVSTFQHPSQLNQIIIREQCVDLNVYTLNLDYIQFGPSP